MRTILHIIFQKPAIKLCLIVLLMLVSINESFSQDYNPQYYHGSYDESLYKIEGIGNFNINGYGIRVSVDYYGGGSLYKPYITHYLYVPRTFMFNTTYSYRVTKKDVDIRDSPMLIYYDSNEICPNYNVPSDTTPCNSRYHDEDITTDWGTYVEFWAFFRLQITRSIILFGINISDTYTLEKVGFSTSRKFYRGSMFGHFIYIGN